MGERTLELNVISAKDLKKVKKIGHQTCYAVAYISSCDKKSSPLDKDGGVNPTWNAQLTFAFHDELLHQAGSYITVEVYSHGYFGNKLLGISRISLFEIYKQARAAVIPKRFVFLVRRPSGVVKGVLNVAVKIGEMRYTHPRITSGEALSPYSDNSNDMQSQKILPASGHSRMSPSESSTPNVENFTGPDSSRKIFLEQHSEGDPRSVYPLLWPSSIVICISSSATECYPMLAYPINSPCSRSAHTAYQHGEQNGTQQCGLNRPSGSQQSYNSTQASGVHNLVQKVHYSSPRSRHCGGTKSSRSRGTGMGLFGEAVGGLLLGDMLV